MKSTISNKENNYSFQNSENYRKDFNCNISEIIEKYSELIIEYFKFIMENIKIKNSCLTKFIIIRGLDTITNVFLNILYFTKNVDLTYFHSQKSYYFYVEFVGQITDDEKTFLQLTSRDATSYVYKKTIFDVSNELKVLNENTSDEFREKMDTIKSFINLYQIYMLKIIQSDKIDVTYISDLSKLYGKLINLTYKSKIVLLENIVDKLYNKISDTNKFFEINHLLVKKFLKKQEIFSHILKKIDLEEFQDKLLTETNDKFINWILADF
jgi:hypothetical protein